MTRLWFAVLFCIASLPALSAPRFMTVDVFIDSDEPVAAWQFELADGSGGMVVVGIESGDSAAYSDPPYYDRDAVAAGHADRLVVADYSLDASLPSGRFRVATLHLMLDGAAPEFELTLVTATTRDGRRINASIDLQEGSGSSS